jgi:hypothetical protein
MRSINSHSMRCNMKRSIMQLLAAILCGLTAAQGQLQNRAATVGPSSFHSLPSAAQSRVSAALGREASSYRVEKFGIGFHAKNVPQKLTADFDVEGVNLNPATGHWKMSLLGYGYGEGIHNADLVVPQAKLNCVEYRRGALTEWYVNGPAGLEQGFTLNEPPKSTNGQPLTIALLLSGDLQASLDKQGTSLSLSRNDAGRPELRYAGLTAHDANGQELQAWMELKGNELKLRIRDAGAHYPVVVDPVVQLAELTASDGVNGDWMGVSVAISGDTVVVGSVNATVGGNALQGAAYVFVKPSSGWANMTETAKLTASDGRAGDGFGGAVGISGDTIVVGACPQSSMCNGPGKVYVFLKPPGGWQTTSEFKAELTASDGQANDGFSNEMSLSGDGGTLVVGAAVASYGGLTNAGAAYIFVKPEGGWTTTTETAKLTAPYAEAYDDFGCVSVSANGSTIFVGALQFDFPDNLPAGPGRAFIFIRPANGWKSTSRARAILTAADGKAGDIFGFCQAGSSCLSPDGTTVLAPAPYANSLQGKAYIFVKPAGGWITTSQFNAELTVPSGGAFGWSAAVTHNLAMVGAVVANRGVGAAYLFVRPKTGWTTTSNFNAELTASNASNGSNFAFSLAISGSTGVVGAPETGGAGPGSAYVFGK